MKYVHEYMWRTANKMTSSYRIEDSEWRDLKVDDVIVMRDEETLIELWFVKEESRHDNFAKTLSRYVTMKNWFTKQLTEQEKLKWILDKWIEKWAIYKRRKQTHITRISYLNNLIVMYGWWTWTDNWSINDILYGGYSNFFEILFPNKVITCKVTWEIYNDIDTEHSKIMCVISKNPIDWLYNELN